MLEFKANWNGWGLEGLLDSEDAIVVLHRSSDTMSRVWEFSLSLNRMDEFIESEWMNTIICTVAIYTQN